MADSRAVVGGLNIGQGKQVSTEGSSAGSMFRPSSSILPKGGRTNPGIEEKDLEASENKWPILVCLLGDFCILKGNYPLMLHGDKTATLVQLLALRKGKIVSREALLDTLWPGRTTALAGQSLNSLIYSLRKTVKGSVLEGGLILQQGGAYRLNTSAGVGVDIALFDNLVQSGHQARAAGEISFSNTCFIQAIRLYRGDLRIGSDINCAIERERLRASFLTVLAQMADTSFAAGDYALAISYAQRILERDPCREDAHRQVMRCFVRQGQRAQAFRQYELCVSALRLEFDVEPEPQTIQLFEQIRLDPTSV